MACVRHAFDTQIQPRLQHGIGLGAGQTIEIFGRKESAGQGMVVATGAGLLVDAAAEGAQSCHRLGRMLWTERIASGQSIDGTQRRLPPPLPHQRIELPRIGHLSEAGTRFPQHERKDGGIFEEPRMDAGRDGADRIGPHDGEERRDALLGGIASQRRPCRQREHDQEQEAQAGYFRITFCSTGPSLFLVHSTIEPS